MEMSTTAKTDLNFQYSKLGFSAAALLFLTTAACGRGNVHAAGRQFQK
jgi:hypothetical protein